VSPSGRIYDSPRLAASYAFNRPRVHPHLVRTIRDQLRIVNPLSSALDIGCGAGLSTAALEPLARTAIGLDPSTTMMMYRREVAPRASFVAARGEALPFADESFDLITAAGSINYAEHDLLLPEVARVLAPRGVFAIYDFAEGRRFSDSPALQEWYAVFEQRYPAQPGYALDVTRLPFERFGLHLDAYQRIEVPVPMSESEYLRYAMSESGVELAVSDGAPANEIEAWCRGTLDEVFAGASHDVLFDAYIAYVSR
jgi:SAM-dependent methyltransferase